MKEKVESPCIECENMVNCKKMCYSRLEWGVFDADPTDEELKIYGNNLQVKEHKVKYEKMDKEVKKLLKEFNDIYKKEVVGYLMSQQASN